MNEEPIEEAEIKTKINAGIEIRDIPFVIPRIHEMEACIRANYRFYDDWAELEYWQRVEIVAGYIVSNLMEAHKDAAVSREMEKQAKKAKGKKK